MKSTEQIAKSVIKSITKSPKELSEFIDFAKVYGIAMKIAFRCDRQAAWELMGIFLRELDKIAAWRRRYNERIDEIARIRKERSNIIEPLNIRLQNILDEAEKLKDEFEKDYINIMKRKKQRSTNDIRK